MTVFVVPPVKLTPENLEFTTPKVIVIIIVCVVALFIVVLFAGWFYCRQSRNSKFAKI